MRTFDEINKDIRHANSINDDVALRSLAAEMQALGTPSAMAAADSSMGIVSLHTGDYPSALEYYRSALARYEELGNRVGVATVTGNMGTVYQSTGDYPAALEHYRRAQAALDELDDRAGVARMIGNTGNVYLNTGDYLLALEHYRHALALFEELGNNAGVASITGNIGNVHVSTGNYEAAIEHYNRALSLHEELGDRAGVARVTGNAGVVYVETGDFPSALGHFHRALTLHEELGDSNGVARVTASIGDVVIETRDYKLALEHLHRALALHEELGDRSGVAKSTASIGRVHLSTGDYPSAYEYFQRSLELFNELGNHASAATVIGNVIGVLLKLDRLDEVATLLDRQGNMQMEDPGVRSEHEANAAALAEHRDDLDAAQHHLLKALAISTEAGLRSASAWFHERLRDLAQKRNDFAEYIEHNKEHQRISEEIRGKEATQRMAVMEAERRMEGERRERDKERALLYGALPKAVADRMIRGEKVTGDTYDNVGVIFLDIVGFTTLSDKIPPGQVVHLLSQIFSALDTICKRHGVTKIKTIGDSYMAVSFANTENQIPKTGHVVSAGLCALEMLAALNDLEITMPPELGDTSWTQQVGEIQVRIGIHCGPVTAGVIGTERLQYDVWGDTVNVASRMESTSEPGRVHVSEAFAAALRSVDSGRWTVNTSNDSMTNDSMTLLERGVIDIKGKGPMTTYWLEPTP